MSFSPDVGTIVYGNLSIEYCCISMDSIDINIKFKNKLGATQSIEAIDKLQEDIGIKPQMRFERYKSDLYYSSVWTAKNICDKFGKFITRQTEE